MQTYIFQLSRAGQPEPDILSVTVSGDIRARELAGEILRRSPDHLTIVAGSDGEPAFQLPGELPGAGNAGPDER
jgi:hypothetical protein